MTLNEMLRLNWAWRGPRRVTPPDGPEFFEMRIGELADFYLAAPTYEGVMEELLPALAAYLESYLDRNESPPLPHVRGWVYVPLRSGPVPAAAAVQVEPRPGQSDLAHVGAVEIAD